jgi:hypothetical protein
MQFVCRTCSAVQSVAPEREAVCAGCGAQLLSYETTLSEHVWHTSGSAGQAGPFDAAQLARRFDRGELAWTDEVWREGLRDWRPARKDDALVVAVANARGLDTATLRLDSLSRLLSSERVEEAEPLDDDTLVDPSPSATTSVSRRTQPQRARRSRSQALANAFKLATFALVAFLSGGLFVSLMGHLTSPSNAAAVAPSLPAASASLVNTAQVEPQRPSSGELIKRAFPARDELRAELRRLGPSARRCVRDAKAGLELEVTVAGASGRPRKIELRTPRMTPGMIECAKAAVQELRIAPFTADQVSYSYHYVW